MYHSIEDMWLDLHIIAFFKFDMHNFYSQHYFLADFQLHVLKLLELQPYKVVAAKNLIVQEGSIGEANFSCLLKWL